jgi:hypothetical protein
VVVVVVVVDVMWCDGEDEAGKKQQPTQEKKISSLVHLT